MFRTEHRERFIRELDGDAAAEAATGAHGCHHLHSPSLATLTPAAAATQELLYVLLSHPHTG